MQCRERNFKKMFSDQERQKERFEVEQENKRVLEQREKELNEFYKKKSELKSIMDNNRVVEKEKFKKIKEIDRSTDHLINKREFEMMSEYEKERYRQQRVKKIKDDQSNRVTIQNRKREEEERKKLRLSLADASSPMNFPFYEQLYLKNKELEQNKKEAIFKHSEELRRVAALKTSNHHGRNQTANM